MNKEGVITNTTHCHQIDRHRLRDVIDLHLNGGQSILYERTPFNESDHRSPPN